MQMYDSSSEFNRNIGIRKKVASCMFAKQVILTGNERHRKARESVGDRKNGAIFL